MSKEFKRQESVRHLKLGKRKKSLRVWRRPKGRDSKMRLKRKGYPSSPTVGNKTPRKKSGKIDNLVPRLVHNVKEAKALPENTIAIIAKIGAKKKLELIKLLNERKIRILNVKEAKK